MNKKELSLTSEEATNLANQLKAELQKGDIPFANEARISQIIAGLGDKRGLIRRTFTESLGAIGKPAIPLLRKALLKHSNVTVRRASAKALKLAGDPSVLPDLLQALINDKDPVVQGSAAAAMAIFGEEAVKHLLAILVSPTSTALQSGLATWGLSFIGAEAPNALREAAQSKNPSIKAAAISALGEQIQYFEDDAAKELVLNALEDEAIEVRAEATALLGKLQEPNWATPFLLKKLSDVNTAVRKNAVLALMKLKTTEVVDELQRKSITENDPDVINVLELAIKQLNRIK